MPDRNSEITQSTRPHSVPRKIPGAEYPFKILAPPGIAWGKSTWWMEIRKGFPRLAAGTSLEHAQKCRRLIASVADRARLEAVVADRNSPQKHVWRARIVLLTTDGLGTVEIKRRTGKRRSFVLLPRRWVVERALAWLNRNRRLAKDFEATLEST